MLYLEYEHNDRWKIRVKSKYFILKILYCENVLSIQHRLSYNYKLEIYVFLKRSRFYIY